MVRKCRSVLRKLRTELSYLSHQERDRAERAEEKIQQLRERLRQMGVDPDNLT